MTVAPTRVRIRPPAETAVVIPEKPALFIPPPPRIRVDKVRREIPDSSPLGVLIQKIEKTHGPAIIRRADILPKFKHIPTGIFAMDISTLGGIPEGLATVGFGWEHSGKSTLGYRIIAKAQKKYQSMRAALIDVEGTYMPDWGAIHDVDNEELLLIQPHSGEQALDIAIAMVENPEISCLAIDSLAGLVPTKMMEKSFEDDVVAMQARLLSRFCLVLQSKLISERAKGHRVAVYFTNQWRTKIVTRGDPRVLVGGVATNYLAAIKIELKNKEEGGSDLQGHQLVMYNDHAFNIKKNKVGIAPREGEFLMVRSPDHPLGQGFIDDARAVVMWAKSVGRTSGGGTSQYIDGCNLKFRTLQDMADHMYEDQEYFEWLKQILIEDYREARGMERNYL